jgi:hypothetical protein
MTQPIPKRADQLILGDRILNVHLPAYARSGDADVLYVEVYHYSAADWVFVAFASRDGDRNSTSYPPDGKIKVHPVPPVGHGYSPADDGEVTQPIAGRAPAEVVGGLVQVDPPEGLVPVSEVTK